MSKPRLLDLFCGAGGCSEGYARAGFEVVGLDHKPQPRYPFPMVVGDALKPPFDLSAFDAIHASPPCQRYSAYRRRRPEKWDEHYVDLVGATRELLKASGRPWIIENVVGAPLGPSVVLCGSMFGLMVQRHRVFESPFLMLAPGSCRHKRSMRLFPGGRSKERGSSRSPERFTVEVGTWDIPLDVQQKAMGIWWMKLAELSQAIPPAYTEYLGRQLIEQLK
jgi:DNA (cytosine-5)-methyltransferase 1